MGDVPNHVPQPAMAKDTKDADGCKEVEVVLQPDQNPVYNADEVEPEIHARTWIAIAAFLLLNYTQVVALQGPAAVMNYIGTDLHNNLSQSWIVLGLSLVQGVLGPIISSASDTFQARKFLLVGTCAISFIGACIAPGSKDIYRLIGATVLIGVGFASVPLAYSVPSEILPRKWRPMVQAGVNVAATIANVTAPLMIGSLTKRNPHTGWRYFYWFQAALWGATTLALLVGYRPPKRHTNFDHLSFWGKLGQMDLIGCGLLMAGLTLFLTGTSLGGALYTWTDARTLATMIVGLVLLVAFSLYEWKGTKTGILHHDLFRGGRNRGRTFSICIILLFVEAVVMFSFGLFYPILTEILFTNDPLQVVGRSQAAMVPAILSTIFWGYISTRYRTIREPLLVGFILLLGGIIGLTTIQPGQNVTSIAVVCLLGLGLGAILVLIVTGVQLSTPHKLIATATACTTSSRAIAGAVFGAIDAAAFNQRIKDNLPKKVAGAAVAAGLPATSLPEFVQALSEGDAAALAKIPGITSTIIAQGMLALQQVYADSIRIVFIIAVPFAVIACILCWFIGDVKETMNFHVDAPVELLHAKEKHHGGNV